MGMWDNLVDRIKGVREPEHYEDEGAATEIGFDGGGYDPDMEASEKVMQFRPPVRNARTHKVIRVKGADYNVKRKEAANYFKEGHVVYLNMDDANKEIMSPVLNFLGGMAYALDGELRRLSNRVYAIIPEGDDISGDVYGDEYSAEYRVGESYDGGFNGGNFDGGFNGGNGGFNGSSRM